MTPPPGAGQGPPPRGLGRQAERTRLAWRRTVLAVTVVAVLAIRLAIQEPATALRLLGITAATAGWLAGLVLGGRRIAAMAAATPAPARRSVPLTALAAIGFAGLGVALVAAR
jgi:hypothetical protein